MEIAFLKEFMVLAESGTFQEAADAVFISQSTLSKHISHMEKELGVALFDRVGRNAVLNSYGKQFLNQAEEIVRTYESFLNYVKTKKLSTTNELVIGCLPAMAQYGITELLAAFITEYPNYQVSVIEQPSDMILQHTFCGDVDLAFIRSEEEPDPRLDSFKVHSDVLSAMVSQANPLAKHETVSFDELRDHNLMLIPVHTTLEKRCTEACQKLSFEPKFLSYARRIGSIIDLAVSDVGVGLSPRKIAEYEANDKIRIIDIVPPIFSDVYLCRMKKRPLSKPAETFIQFVRDHPLE